MDDVNTKRLRVAGILGGHGGLPIPATAEVGQYIVVSAVDENGVVTATEAVTMEAEILEDAAGVAF